MNDALFFQSFTFLQFSYQHDQHNNLRSGVDKHFFGYMKSGRGLLTTKNQRIDLFPGDLFYIPPKFPYQSHWYGSENTCFDSFGFYYLPSLTKKYAIQKISYDSTTEEILTRLSTNKTVNGTSIGLLYSLFGMVEPHMKLRTPNIQNQTLEAAIEYITENPNTSMPEVATAIGISETSLYRLCKKHTHTTPNGLRHRILCEKATELLTTTDLPIEEISYILGFSSSSYFRKIFFAEVGKTPRQFRKEATRLQV